MKSQIRKLMRRALIHGLWISGATRWMRGRLVREDAVLVLMLHRVLPVADRERSASEAATVVSDEAYRQMIAYIEENYRLVDAAAPSIAFRGNKLGIALTFDDGWEDNYTPLLRDRQNKKVPAMVFVSPALTGKNFPFWPERLRSIMGSASEKELFRLVESLKVLTPEARQAQIDELAAQHGLPASEAGGVDRTMTWQQLDELREAGIALGSHTLDHEILTSLEDGAAVDHQLLESKRQIEKRWGDCLYLAYPNGGHNDAVVERVRRAGYLRAFTTKPGIWTAETDPLRVPRMNITDERVTFDGKFSPAAFDFSVVCRAYRAWRAARKGQVAAPAAAQRVAAGSTYGD